MTAQAEPHSDTRPHRNTQTVTTTCYMCACRCGIRVHLQDGQIRYIDGNPDHPVNKGVLCAKGSAGIMQHLSPARLTAPLKRVGPRGTGQFVTISWDEALATVTERLGRIRATDPRRLALYTGRDQSQALTGWWASQFGTPNYAAHGGFCSVNMAAAGLYTFGGSFWEFGEPDWEHTRYFLLFGVAEDHGSNPLKIGLAKLRARGAKIVSINPIRTGYSAIADEWLGIRPGTDGLLVASLIRELLRAQKIDTDTLTQTSNAAWLVIDAPGTADDGLIARDDRGHPLTLDAAGTVGPAFDPARTPVLGGTAMLADGRQAVPAFQLTAARFLDDRYAPETVAAETGIDAATIRRIAAELADAAFSSGLELPVPWTDWQGTHHETMVGRPVSMHAMRGVSAHSNGFHTCRLIHLLQMLLGTIDAPGGFRYKPPYPKPIPPAVKPAGKPAGVVPNWPLSGPPLGFPTAPEDLLVERDGRPCRLDKAYSWEAPLAAHGLMHLVIRNAWAGDPYPIDTLFMFMANMSWNSSMAVGETLRMLTDKDATTGEYRIPFLIYSDAYASEMVAYADIVLPDTTYLERHDCISLLDRPISDADGAADSIRRPVVAPDRDVRPFQDVLIEIGARLKLPGLVTDDGSPRYPGLYPDYMVHHERKPGQGLLAGWRGAQAECEALGPPNPYQLDAYMANGCFWRGEIPEDARYFKHVNQAYLDWATDMGFLDRPEPVIHQLYAESLQRFRLAAAGHGLIQPPDEHRQRIATYFDPLPFWYPPFEVDAVDAAAYPLHALTQRPMAMYHAWGSQNAWLRQIHGENRLYVARPRAAALGIRDDDWVRLTSHHGTITAQARLMEGVNPDTVWTWNAIGKRAGAWNLAPDAPEATRGFLMNHLISDLLPAREGGYRYANADPVTGQAAWYDLKVRLEKVAAPDAPLPALGLPRGQPARPTTLGYGSWFRKNRKKEPA
ncbi:formate dehydrogenase [Aliidongia dinghuensis]|uniref:Formate dehydrogenase n=1 Tax=Aliidongia dinghuensis TaxID=1867774 RepID=A0A8J2YQ19_9PROT|nr:molybdopterin oxidoreductase family protein [Aliidongia dinghuensis]GGF03858.1 formate dehydrogenase [Aliidongia dinghuensis]